MAMLASPSTSLSSCEALVTQEEGRYYPLLRHAAVEAACAPESAAPSDGGAESDDAANATVPAVCCSCMHVHRIYPACTLHVHLHVHAHAACMHSASHATTRPGDHMPPHAQVVALPAPADTVFSRATLGLGGHGALVAATQAWCANMRATRSIATSCMRLPAHASSAAAAAAESWVPVSVCCSSDLCQIRDGAATAAFSHAALDDGAGLDCNPGCDPGLRLTPCNPGCNPACPACSPMHLRCGRARVLPPQGRSDRSGRRWRTHRLGS